MTKNKEWVFSVRTQLFTKDQKQYLEFELFTDIEKYKFDKMSNAIKMDCKVPRFVISDLDAGISKLEKEKRQYCAEDFDCEEIKTQMQTVEKKYWNGKTFQIYVGKNFNAYKKIVPFFCNVISLYEQKNKKSEKEL